MLEGMSMLSPFRNIFDPVTQDLIQYLLDTADISTSWNSIKLQKLSASSGKYFLLSILKSSSTSFMEHPGAIVLQDQTENIASESKTIKLHSHEVRQWFS